MKALVVGEAPSTRKSGDDTPVGGTCGARLAGFVGLPALRPTFDTANLFEDPVARWSALEARARAARLLETRPNRVLVLLGARVARAFWLSAEPFELEVRGPWRFVKIPHPSGRNRIYNDGDARYRAGDFLRWALDLVDAGKPGP